MNSTFPHLLNLDHLVLLQDAVKGEIYKIDDVDDFIPMPHEKGDLVFVLDHADTIAKSGEVTRVAIVLTRHGIKRLSHIYVSKLD